MPDDLIQGMHELLWVLAAFALLGLLMILGVGKGRTNALSVGLGLDDILEGGLFLLVVLILLLPLYPFYVLGAVVWHKLHPPRPPVVLPVEGDDPIWGRNVNRKVVEEAFLAVQQALTKRDPAIARDFLGDDPRDDLRRECRRLIAQHETSTREMIQIADVDFRNERIDDYKFSDGKHAITYYLDVTIHGTMINVTRRDEDGQITAGQPDPQPFEETMQFARGPGDAGRWVMVESSGIPQAKDKTAKKDKPKQKRSVHKAEHTSS